MPTIFYSLLNRIFLLRSRSKLSFHFSFRHRPPEQEEGKEGKNVFHHNEKYLKVFFIFHSITGREQRKKNNSTRVEEKIDINDRFSDLFHCIMLKIEINIFIEINFDGKSAIYTVYVLRNLLGHPLRCCF